MFSLLSRSKYLMLDKLTLLILVTSLLSVKAASNSDTQCCRKRIECFECDSRFDSRCGDSFNLTRETGMIVPCDDYCVKLKHKYGNRYYYVRTCAETLKRIYIKKTDVCYTTRTNDGGHLCFCDQELCNSAIRTSYFLKIYDNRIHLNLTLSYLLKIALQLGFVIMCSSSLITIT
jgi:hypothetical protein